MHFYDLSENVYTSIVDVKMPLPLELFFLCFGLNLARRVVGFRKKADSRVSVLCLIMF